jgi:hypothetical protein
VVQHTDRVHSKLKFFRLRNLHAFDEVGVEIEASRSLDPFPARLHSIPEGASPKRRLPLASVIALLVKLPLSPLGEMTAAADGSVIC